MSETSLVDIPITTRDLSTDFADFLKIVADPTRLRILLYLAKVDIEPNVDELISYLDMEQSTVSKSLTVLHKSRLVNKHKIGKEVYLSFNKEYTRRKLDELIQRLF